MRSKRKNQEFSVQNNFIIASKLLQLLFNYNGLGNGKGL